MDKTGVARGLHLSVVVHSRTFLCHLKDLQSFQRREVKSSPGSPGLHALFEGPEYLCIGKPDIPGAVGHRGRMQEEPKISLRTRPR